MKILRRAEYGTREVVVNAELVKENNKTVWVKLRNGAVIKRSKKDIVQY